MRILFAAALALLPAAQAELKPITGDVQSVMVFKTLLDIELKMNLFFPKDWKAEDRRPALVLFFGGGFVAGSPSQFTGTAQYFATRGLVVATPEYRVKKGADKSIEDAKSAIRWVRMNAQRLGIDPDRIAAGGGSAGGTCATLAAYNNTYEPDDGSSVSSKPNALVLYNPALGFGHDTSQAKQGQVQALGAVITNWKVTKGGPPAILFFGTDDSLGEGGRSFAEKMIAAGNRAEFYTAAGQKHGFFNEKNPGPWHALVVYQSDLFLASLGYLQGAPTITRPTEASLKKELPGAGL
jgi:acetyl esterase/lipase